jgi:hypothetical protein
MLKDLDEDYYDYDTKRNEFKEDAISEMLMSWTASQCIKLVVQKQRQWLARYPSDKILSSGQLP